MDFLLDKLLYLPGILIGFSFHEYAHAKVAYMLGDDTPFLQGRITLDPKAHIDPLGFIFLLLAGFGWAKPVEVNPRNFKNPKRDDILVSIAGPLMNVFLAAVFLVFIKILFMIQPAFLYSRLGDIIIDLLSSTVWINVVLAIFNLLPVPPLDGFHVLSGLLDLKGRGIYYDIVSKGRLVLLLLIIINLLDAIISPPIVALYQGLSRIIL